MADPELLPILFVPDPRLRARCRPVGPGDADQVRAAWFWMMATRAAARPVGGPSWISIPAKEPGRSTASRSSAAPWAARERNLVQPASPPTANAVEAMIQPIAERPRTGTTVTTVTKAQIKANVAADAHACSFKAQKTGIVEIATMLACHPVRPKGNHPIRALEYSLYT